MRVDDCHAAARVLTGSHGRRGPDRPLGGAGARVLAPHRTRRPGRCGARVRPQRRRNRGRRLGKPERAPSRDVPGRGHRDDQRLSAAHRRHANGRKDEHSVGDRGERTAPGRDRCGHAAGSVGVLPCGHRPADRLAGGVEPARHRVRGVHPLRAPGCRSPLPVDRVRARAPRSAGAQGHALRAGAADVPVSRVLPRRRGHKRPSACG